MAQFKEVTFVNYIPLQNTPTVSIVGQERELLNLDQVRRIAREVDAVISPKGTEVLPIYKIEYQNGDKAFVVWRDSDDPLSGFAAGKPLIK